MRVRFLGTGASPAMPIPYCACAACRRARTAGGKNLRRRSALLVDEELLIDLGPDVATASFEAQISLEGMQICAQTHPHADHFDAELLISRHPEWGTMIEGQLLLLGSQRTLEELDRIVQERSRYGSLFEATVQQELRLRLRALRPFEPVEVGPYRITPYPANHAHEFDAFIYRIERERRSLFYATDTSVVDDSLWDRLSDDGTRFDLVVLDQTYGMGYASRDHLAATEVARYAGLMRRRGLLKPDGSVYATHLSHEGILEHEVMERWAVDRGYHIAYDGLRIELGRGVAAEGAG